MSNNYLTLSFVVPATPQEVALVLECEALAAELNDLDPDDLQGTYVATSAAFKEAFPKVEGQDYFGAFFGMFSDPDFTGFGVTFVPGDGLHIYGDQADPDAIANLLRATCKSALPLGFEWATTCDSMRVGEFGGGFFKVTEDAVTGGSTSLFLSDELCPATAIEQLKIDLALRIFEDEDAAVVPLAASEVAAGMKRALEATDLATVKLIGIEFFGENA